MVTVEVEKTIHSSRISMEPIIDEHQVARLDLFQGQTPAQPRTRAIIPSIPIGSFVMDEFHVFLSYNWSNRQQADEEVLWRALEGGASETV